MEAIHGNGVGGEHSDGPGANLHCGLQQTRQPTAYLQRVTDVHAAREHSVQRSLITEDGAVI